MERRAIQQLGYAVNLNRRWLVERCFTWLKQTGQLRQVNLRGLMNVDWSFAFSCAARNLVQLLRLMAQAVVCLCNDSWLRKCFFEAHKPLSTLSKSVVPTGFDRQIRRSQGNLLKCDKFQRVLNAD
jgi:hypothetical protein